MRTFLFTMDYLNFHRHPIVSNLIYGRGHHAVFSAPYWSCDGSIEYVFNTVQTRLQMDVHGVDTVFDLVNKINTIVGNMPSFKHYFMHVGFLGNSLIIKIDYKNEILYTNIKCLLFHLHF